LARQGSRYGDGAVTGSNVLEDRVANVKIEGSSLPSMKALGVQWNAETDMLTFKLSPSRVIEYTKRGFLKKLATLFDPLQMLAQMLERMALQETWLLGLGWDEEFPVELEKRCKEWFSQLPELSGVQVPRCYREVRNALLCDSTGTIKSPVWQDHIKKLVENKFYTITDTKLRYYKGKCLSTTKTTQIINADSQDVPQGTITKDNTQWLCCPSIMNVPINAYPVCNNKDCSRKITNNTAGSRVIHCQSCNRAMLLKQCSYEMSVNFHLEKGDTI